MNKLLPWCLAVLLAMTTGLRAAGQAARPAVPQEPITAPDLDGMQPTPPIDPAQGISTQKPGKKPEFIFAPIPFSNPTIGTGLALGGAYIFPFDARDRKSPPSIIGAGAMATDNGTNGALVGSRLYLSQDRYRILAGLLTANLNYDYFGIGTQANSPSVPLGQVLKGILVEGLVRTKNDVFLGLRYMGGRSDVTVRSGGSELIARTLRRLDLSTNVSGITARAFRDTRDNTFYPTRGGQVDLRAAFHSNALGDDFDYQIYSLLYTRYQSLGGDRVFAYKGYVRDLVGDAPFYAYSTVGGNDGQRGYVIGQFRDRSLLSAQAEYRQFFSNRFGFALFTGASIVGADFGSLNWDNFAPSIGVGVRYRLSKQNPVSYRIDYALGSHSDALYFAVGEAF